jgi:hypothetical protein
MYTEKVSLVDGESILEYLGGNVKTIQDPVHDAIQLPEVAVRLVDTPEFQRLRRVSQLGFTNLVYPGANHTRFEHSLGVFHVALKLLEKLEADAHLKAEIALSALLHDICHTPFSHSGERILREYLNIGHERIDILLKGSEVEDILNSEGFSLKRIAKHISGGSGFEVVSGDIDSDRMDYLVRDSHYTGVAYGVFDISRLITTIYFLDGKLIISEKGLRSAESLLISRFMMYPTVYYHHVCRIARKMYERALESAIEVINPERLVRMDDYSAIAEIRNSTEYAREMVNRILNRKLFKRAIYVGKDRVGINIEKINEKRAEKEISEISGVDIEKIIVDIPPLTSSSEVMARIEIDGTITTLENCSPIVKSLKIAERDSWKLGVYTTKDNVEKVAKASIDFFKIDKSVQKRLDEVIRF